jgi:hypothetical protein
MNMPPASPAAAAPVASAGAFALEAMLPTVRPAPEAASATECSACLLRVERDLLRPERELPRAEVAFDPLREVEPRCELELLPPELRDFVCAI